MKNTLISLIIMCVSIGAGAQIDIGITASYNKAMSSQDEAMLPLNRYSYAYKLKFVGHSDTKSFGIAFHKDFGKLYWLSEVQYRKTNYYLDVLDYSRPSAEGASARSTMLTESKSVIHIPITAGVKFGKVRLGLGPIFNYKIESISMPVSAESDMVNKERKMTNGFHFDLGYQVHKYFTTTLRYEYMFSSIGDLHYYRGKDTKLDSKLNYLTFSIGFFLQ